jgi:uncharacterized membrane protein
MLKIIANILFTFTLFIYLAGGGLYLADLLRLCAATGSLALIFAFSKGFRHFQVSDIWLVKGFSELSSAIQKRQWPSTSLGICTGLSVIYLFGCFILMPLMRHWGFASWFWDLAVMEQVIWREASGLGLTSTAILDRPEPILQFLKNGHLNFWLYPTAFLYSFVPRTELLLIMQSLALLLAVVPLWKIGQRLFPKSISPILLPLLYWCWDPIHRINVWDIHEMAYLPVVTLWAYYFFLEKKWLGVTLCLVATGFFKEDAWIVAGAMGFYFFGTYKKWWQASSILILGFLIYVTYGVFFNKVNVLSDRYNYLGAHFSESIPIILHDPLIFLRALMQPMSLKFLGRLILSGGGLWLFSGFAIVPLIPTILECALSTAPSMPNFNNHYVLALGGPLFFATAMGVSRLPYIFKQKSQLILSSLVLVGVAQLYFAEPKQILEITNSELWRNRACLTELTRAVPKEAPLYSIDPLTTHLSTRPILLRYVKDKVFDYPHSWLAMPADDLLPIGFSEVTRGCGYKIAKMNY